MKGGWLVVRFLGIGCLVVGGLFVGLAGWAAYRPYRILTTWPAVDAEVVRSEVFSQSAGSRMRGGSGGTVYGAAVLFRYTVAGREYLSRTDVGYLTSDVGTMQEWTRLYPVGTHQGIRYHPADPQRISLAVGYDAAAFAPSLDLLRWALVVGGVGVACLLGAKRYAPVVAPPSQVGEP